MLTELKFIMSSVARKDYVPGLTHVVIENNTIRGYNGKLAMCAPIPFDLKCKPKAAPLYAAIRNCGESISLSMTPAGRLSIRSGAFKAFVDCTEEEAMHVLPEGERIAINGEAFLEAMKRVEPFIADDASRPWSNGVLLKGQSAFATNNVILVEFWMGGDTFPLTINFPRDAVKEVLRVDEAPEYAQANDTSFTLHYASGRWIRTQLLSTEWPDLARVLNREAKPLPLPDGFFEGVEAIRPFTDKMGSVYFESQMLCTSLVEGEGASATVPGFDSPGRYVADMLLKLRELGQITIDFSAYPDPCIFYGDRMRGAIIGMRLQPKTPQ